MYHPIGPGPLFRVASAAATEVWPAPVKGLGAHYIPVGGNRYNVVDQYTVHCAEDPLVAITEGAFYQALAWQEEIGVFHLKAVNYPLRSRHFLWAFRIEPRPPVVYVESPLASHLFAYPPHVLLNPSRVYGGTQLIAQRVRAYDPPAGSGRPRPEGMKVPSVRTPYAKKFQPYHLALFVKDAHGSKPLDQRAVLVAKMHLEFEFFTHRPATSVAYEHARIDWSAPRFRATAIPDEPALIPIPAGPGRPDARSYALNRWHRLKIVF